ncbi:MAG TPA: hypothetical protein VEO54_29835 [Thermoanaerobaculia bacterium]|nr:hypothetical protein [Thermoanaerobaculia bacterium]
MAGDDERVKEDRTAELDILHVDEQGLPALVKPVTLVQGLQFLQQRIPGFRQLSLDEQQSMGNAAHLEPEFVNAGIHAAGVWPESKTLTGMTAEEMRAGMDATVSWADVRRQLQALDKGIAGAILSEKHRIGVAILQIYRVIGTLLSDPRYHHLRPYYEDMKRTYGRKPRKPRKAPKQKPETPEE